MRSEMSVDQRVAPYLVIKQRWNHFTLHPAVDVAANAGRCDHRIQLTNGLGHSSPGCEATEEECGPPIVVRGPRLADCISDVFDPDR